MGNETSKRRVQVREPTRQRTNHQILKANAIAIEKAKLELETARLELEIEKKKHERLTNTANTRTIRRVIPDPDLNLCQVCHSFVKKDDEYGLTHYRKDHVLCSSCVRKMCGGRILAFHCPYCKGATH